MKIQMARNQAHSLSHPLPLVNIMSECYSDILHALCLDIGIRILNLFYVDMHKTKQASKQTRKRDKGTFRLYPVLSAVLSQII